MNSNKLVSYGLLAVTAAYAALHFFYAATLENIGWKLTALFPAQFIGQFETIRHFSAYLLLALGLILFKIFFFGLFKISHGRPRKEILSAIFVHSLIFYFLMPFIAVAFQSFLYSIDWPSQSGELSVWLNHGGKIFVLNCLFMAAVFELCFLRLEDGDNKAESPPHPRPPWAI